MYNPERESNQRPDVTIQRLSAPQRQPDDAKNAGACASLKNAFLACFTACFYYALPFSLYWFIQLASSSNYVFYSFVFISGAQPEDISASWWNSMSLGEKTFSVLDMCASLVTTILVNNKYFPSAITKFKNNFLNYCQNLQAVVSNTLLFTFGMTAALVSAAVAFDSMLWTRLEISYVIGFANFVAYAARRYVGLVDLVQILKNTFDTDWRFQNRCSDYWYRLDNDAKAAIEDKFDDKPLDEKNVASYLHHVFAACEKPVNTAWDYTYNVLNFLSKFTIAAISALCIFPIGIQKGFEGFRLFNKSYFNDLSWGGQFSFGMLSAIPTTAFYFSSGWSVPHSIGNMFRCMQNNFWKIPTALVVTVFNALTVTATYVVTKSIVKKPNLLGISETNGFGQMLPLANTITTGLICINNSDSIFQPNSTFGERAIHWMESNKLSPRNMSSLRALSFFQDATPRQHDDIEIAANASPPRPVTR